LEADRKKTLLVALLLVVAIGAIGYSSMSQSNYKSLDAILSLDEKSKVTVEANTTSMGEGQFIVVINGEQYTVTAHKSYGVARGPDGEIYAVFILESKGARALALYPVGDEVLAYQTGSGLQTTVVVSGIYDPNIRAIIIFPDGSQASMPVIFVDSILKGCHTSYEQGQASIG